MRYPRNRRNQRYTQEQENQTQQNEPVMSPPDTTLIIVVTFLVVIGLMSIFSLLDIKIQKVILHGRLQNFQDVFSGRKHLKPVLKQF